MIDWHLLFIPSVYLKAQMAYPPNSSL